MELYAFLSDLGIAAVGAGSAILGAYLSSRQSLKMYKLQSSEEDEGAKRKLRIERGEELYGMLSVFGKNIVGNNLLLYSVMRGETTYDKHLDFVIAQDLKSDYDVNRMDMLLEVYFPQLEQQYGVMMANLEEHNRVITEHKGAYQSNPSSGKSYIAPFSAAQKNFVESIDALKRSLSTEIRSIFQAQESRAAPVLNW